MAQTIRDPYSMGAYYELKVNNQDVNPFVIGDVVLENGEDRISTLSFTLNNGQFFVEKLNRYMNVSLFAGSMDVNNRRLLFKGVIKKINAVFPKNGRPQVQIVAFSGVYRAARSQRTIVYPSDNCERDWAKGKTEIKLSEIVRNMLDESFYGYPVEVDIKTDRTFTLKNPYVQKGVTDWVALRELAKLCNCVLYEQASNQDAQHKIFFVDQHIAKNNTDNRDVPISFRYISREVAETWQDVRRLYDSNNFQKFNYRDAEILVDEMNFAMNVDLTGSLRIVTDFQEGAADSKTYVQQYDDETDTLMTYELKPAEFFNALPDGVVKQFWDRLTYHWSEVTLEEIEPFFNKVNPDQSKVAGYEDTDISGLGAGPLGWVGYEIQMTIIGDVQILPYRYYPVYGIGKFSSKNGKGKYYVKSLTHTWGTGGYKQTLNLLK